MFQCLPNSTMVRYTIEQRVKIVKVFSENGRLKSKCISCNLCCFLTALSNKYFHNQKNSSQSQVWRKCENSFAGSPSSFCGKYSCCSRWSCRRAVNPSRHRDLNSHAYKVQLAQELNSTDHFNRCQ